MKSFIISLNLILFYSSLFAQISYLGPTEPNPTEATNNISNYYYSDSNNSIYKIWCNYNYFDSLKIYKNVSGYWLNIADDTLKIQSWCKCL